MRPALGIGISKRSRQKQMWVDKDFKEWLKDVIRRKEILENHDFSFADITADIIRCTELKNGIEESLLRRRRKDEAKLF